MSETIAEVLMRRDGLTASEAECRISEACEELQDLMDSGEATFDMCENICASHFGLEPDYFDELLERIT